MPAESDDNLHLEIGHVLFIDIVGYSKLLIEEQKERLHQLTAIVLATAQVRTSTDEQLVRLPTGDGMALVFHHSAEEPARCALEIAAALQKHPDLPVRMGIHSGPVSEVRDVSGRSNIAGAGINMAQRVMDCGDAGHILLSQHVADDLVQYRQWAPRLHDLGDCEVKHGVRLHLVNLYAEPLGNAALPQKFQQAKPKPARRINLGWIAALALAAILAAGAAYYYFSAYRSASKGAAIPEKSIAVLPFENLSRDPENAYFAEGIQEEILTRVAKVADLKVISRTSTQRFKSAPGDLRQIAQQLGVAHILEGSVQKSADQVRVNVQLIEAATDAHLWAEIYDRKLTDVFGVETEIAKKIADSLQAKLTGSEQKAMAARPTENTEAHELYLKGRYFWGKRTGDGFRKALDYFHQALNQDPNYALAYAGIADCYVLLIAWTPASPVEYLPKARAAANKALEIDNSLGEAHASLGEVMIGELNPRDARREFERAIELNPNYATAHHWLGIDALAPLGEHDHAIAELKRAVELDPFSAIINANLGLSYTLARRYSEAIAQLRKTVELDPAFPYAHSMLGEALVLSGQLDQAIGEYERTYNISHEHFPLLRAAHAYALKGDRKKALQLFNQAKELGKPIVWAFGCALVHIGLGDKEEAINWLEQSYRQKESTNISLIRVHPFLDPLRGDPRFEKLADKIIGPQQNKQP
ncbi:MAG: hypothetical protein H0X40_05260 [Chthoniobacterales bacterium]|nr:hypothetical protein [Chthoniobacterales bacterium]